MANEEDNIVLETLYPGTFCFHTKVHIYDLSTDKTNFKCECFRCKCLWIARLNAETNQYEAILQRE